MRRRWTLAAVLAALFVPAAPAAGYVYWTDTVADTVGRAQLDGTGVDPDFVAGLANPCGTAVDSRHLYWAQQGTASIARADVDGSDVDQTHFPASVGYPYCSVSVDAAHVHWTRAGGGIGRAAPDGSGLIANLIPSDAQLCGVATDSEYVYWAELQDGGIGRATRDGLAIDHSLFNANNQPCGVAVNGTHIFYGDLADGTIGRANIDGTPHDDGFIAAPGQPCDVEIDGTHLYWSDYQNGTIGRARLDGSAVDPDFISGLEAPCGVAVDAEPEPPETTIAERPRKRTRKRRASFGFASDEQGSRFECSLDRAAFTACEAPVVLKRLKRRRHRFEVRAVDPAGTVDPTPAVHRWKVRRR